MAEPAWILIDTSNATVSVYQDQHTVLQLHGAAFGRGGIAALHVRGDDRTPLGRFRIVRIDHRSRFREFFELNYPTAEQARLGYQQGIISKAVMHQIVWATNAGRIPPQDTPLGGDIGIHGLGKGSLWIQRRFNWTRGCVALTNQQIEKLAPWLEIGTRVVIQ